MRNSKPSRRKILRNLVGVFLAVIPSTSYSDVRVSEKWDPRFLADGTHVPDSTHEIRKITDVAAMSVLKRTAVPKGERGWEGQKERAYKVFLDTPKFYLVPYLFMPRSHPDEVCTPAKFKNTPTYQCEEGQRYTVGANLFLFNEKFEEVGYHLIKIAEPWPLFCNSVLAVGTGDKKRNELLVTVQYFPVDRKAASAISQIGSGWMRMTVLLRVKVEGGKVLIEQDDRCLGNPNKFETIPEARRRLKKCAIGKE